MRDNIKIILIFFLTHRNNVYNLSLSNLKENVASRIEWPSSDAHREMCSLKGKNMTDCQNYIRIFARVDHQIVLCGTNSFKPACRYYKENLISSSDLLTYEMIQEFQGEGECLQNYPHTPYVVLC